MKTERSNSRGDREDKDRNVEIARTNFEVLDLKGQVLDLCLEVSSPRKLPCHWIENSTIF